MSKFNLTVEMTTDNDAFEFDREYEVWRILGTVTDKIAQGRSSGTCFDLNGNNVGTWKVTK